MPVASDEDPPPRKEATPLELAEFADWGEQFVDFLHSTPTAEEDR